MKTIKIIDLLNKIATGKEVPQKIRIGALYMYWDGSVYWDEDGESQFCEVIGSSEYSLNREVEIIEEEKETKLSDLAEMMKKIIDTINELKRDK